LGPIFTKLIQHCSSLPHPPPPPLSLFRRILGWSIELESKFLALVTEVKSSYEVGLKSTQTWGCLMCLCSIKCLFKHIESAHTPFSTLLLLPRNLPFSIGCFVFNNWGNIHRNSSSLDWGEKLDFGVDSEIRLGYNKLEHRVPYPMFFFIQPLFSEFVLTV
jgi:hypothetical protein